MVGTLPEKVEDPVLIEIFGMHHRYFEGLKAGDEVTVFTGFAASAGATEGRARVLLSATELYDLEQGEILVCEATSPNWTPAFATDRGLRLRRRWLADPCGDRVPRSTASPAWSGRR